MATKARPANGPRNSLRPEDLKRFRLISSPTARSEESCVACLIETVREDETGYQNSLWLFSQEAAPRELVSDRDVQIQLPRFAPCGSRLAFIASLPSGVSALRTIDVDTGVTETLRVLDGNISELEWIDAERIALVSNRNPRDEFVDKTDIVRISWLHYKKDGVKNFSQPLSEVWIISLTGTDAGSTDLNGTNPDAEQGPLSAERVDRLLYGSGSQITQLATSAHLVAFATEQRHVDSIKCKCQVVSIDPSTGTIFDEWNFDDPIDDLVVTYNSSQLLAVIPDYQESSAPIPRIVSLTKGGKSEILFAGEDLACEYSVQGDTRPTKAGNLVRQVEGSDDILFATTMGRDVALFFANTESQNLVRVSPKGLSITDFSNARNGRVYAALESPLHPVELYRIDLRNEFDKVTQSISHSQSLKNALPVSDLNEWLSEYVGEVDEEEVTTTTDENVQITAAFYPAPNADASPLIVRIHGGPHLCYGDGFDFELHVALARGFSVLLPNIRGSSGRGSGFRNLSIGQWGRKDYEELTALVDLVSADKRIDSKKVFLQGGSYGGYLTNFALTQTNRFKAAVSERSVSSLISKYGTSDNGFTTNKSEMKGADLFDEGLSELIERSPLFHADKIETPLLLIHGEKDYRCPIEQSEQMFSALRRLGKEVVFCRIPDESHNFSYSGRPDHRIARLHLIMKWFAGYQ